nr:peptidoglycan-binding domain-containing protein [uncultured Pedobacter sp.]
MATGKQFLESAQKHIGEKYVYGAKVPFDNPNYKGAWDCAEFISWVVYQVAKVKIGIRGDEAYTGYWTKDVTKFCKQISISEATQTYGAILLRSPGYKGIAIGHIVFSDGAGGTIEAKSSKDGVCRSKVADRQWEFGLLINNIDYEVNPVFHFDYNLPTKNFYVTKPLMKSAIVRSAKQKLAEINLYHSVINDIYDIETAKAVTNYQNIEGLVVDGILGKQTLASLNII